MKKFALVTAAVAFAALASPAFAQDYSTGGPWYAGLGYTHYDTSRGDLGGITGRLGYNFTPHIGAEAEYTGGVSDDDFGKLDNAWGAYGVGTLPVSSNFELIGRLGYQETNINGKNGATDVDSHGLGAGVGAVWHVAGFGIRGEYTRLQGDEDIDSWSLGGSMKF